MTHITDRLESVSSYPGCQRSSLCDETCGGDPSLLRSAGLFINCRQVTFVHKETSGFEIRTEKDRRTKQSTTPVRNTLNMLYLM